MKPISELYKTSTDYERLVELLLFKGEIICIVDEVVVIAYFGKHKSSVYRIGGIIAATTQKIFIEKCNHHDVKFIDPNEE